MNLFGFSIIRNGIENAACLSSCHQNEPVVHLYYSPQNVVANRVKILDLEINN